VNFRLLVDCSLWILFEIIAKVGSPKFWASFYHGKSYVLILTKNVLGNILGDFFTNASGHPGRRVPTKFFSTGTMAQLVILTQP
jgi:hypothetical protein